MLTIDVSNAPTQMITMAGRGDNGVTYRSGRNQPGKCTRWVWLALGGFANTTGLGYAVAAWNNAPVAYRHTLSEQPFRGAVVVLGAAAGPRWKGDQNWMYGDVVLVTGRGLGGSWENWEVVGTDSLLGLGIIGTMTLAQRMRQTGRRILGWLSSYGGAILLPGRGSAPVTSTTKPPAVPIPEQRNDPMVTQLQSDQGQSLVVPGVGNVAMSPADVRAGVVALQGPAVQVVHIGAGLHARIGATAQANRDRVRIVYQVQGSGYAYLEDRRFSVLHSMDAVNALTRSGVPVVTIAPAEFDALAKEFGN